MKFRRVCYSREDLVPSFLLEIGTLRLIPRNRAELPNVRATAQDKKEMFFARRQRLENSFKNFLHCLFVIVLSSFVFHREGGAHKHVSLSHTHTQTLFVLMGAISIQHLNAGSAIKISGVHILIITYR